MVWARFDDGFWTHQKVLMAGNEAVGAFVRMVCYSCNQLTDGFVPMKVARFIAPPSVLRKLMDVGLLEAPANGQPEGYSVHDFLTYQPSRESVESEREKTKSRVAKHRENNVNVPQRNGVTPPVTNAVSNAVSNPAPSRPDPAPTQDTNTLSPAAVAPSALPAQATVTTLALDLDEPTPPKPAKAKRAAKPPADPPPFSIGAAFEALAGAAGGRFAAGLDVDWTRGIRIAVAKRARQYPDLAAWGLVGEWLAAGGDRFRGVLGPSWAASTALADAMARAREWDATGRPALAGAPANSGQTSSQMRSEPDAWSAAAKRNGVAL